MRIGSEAIYSASRGWTKLSSSQFFTEKFYFSSPLSPSLLLSFHSFADYLYTNGIKLYRREGICIPFLLAQRRQNSIATLRQIILEFIFRFYSRLLLLVGVFIRRAASTNTRALAMEIIANFWRVQSAGVRFSLASTALILAVLLHRNFSFDASL